MGNGFCIRSMILSGRAKSGESVDFSLARMEESLTLRPAALGYLLSAGFRKCIVHIDTMLSASVVRDFFHCCTEVWICCEGSDVNPSV